MGFGDYPAEYNPKIHGVYDPARYYGKRKFQLFEYTCKKTIFKFWLLCNKFSQKHILNQLKFNENNA